MTQDPEKAGPTPALKQLRDQLDQIDTDIIHAVARRFETVGHIIREKQGRSAGIRDAKREGEVLARVEQLAEAAGISGPLARKLFAEILSHSVTRQASTLTGVESAGPELNIAYQGSPFTFNHLAAQKFVAGQGRRGQLLGKASFRQVIAAVESGEADLAFLLLENTSAGSINKVYEILLQHEQIHIVGEETYKVDMCLGATTEAPLSTIERVLSHPLALEQCSAFLDALPKARAVPVFDTAEALWMVAQSKDPTQAAIGSPEGLEAFGLVALQRGIGNHEEIFNRYVALARAPIDFDARIPCKTSLVMATRHEPGALLRCLQALADRGLSLTKLESRPRPHRPWEYLFFLDFEGNLNDPNTADAIVALKANTTFFKLLGCYPARATRALPGVRPTLAP